MSVKPVEFSGYAGTYYVEVKNGSNIETYEKVSGNSPKEVAKLFLENPIKCGEEESTVYVISNSWRFGGSPRNNYYR